MTRYTRPATVRTYDAIQADIDKAVTALADSKTDDGFWGRQAEGCERLRDLWNEIVFQAVDDRNVPRWARFAAINTRDDYAQQARDARRQAKTA